MRSIDTDGRRDGRTDAGGHRDAGPVPPDAAGRVEKRAEESKTSPVGPTTRRTVLRALGAGAAAAAVVPGSTAAAGLPESATARGASGGGATGPAETGSSSLQDGGDDPVCFEPRETGTDRSVACRYDLVGAGEGCPDQLYTPCGSTEEPCPFGGTEVELPESGCSGTLRLSGQFCTTPVEHDVKYWPVPCGDEEPKHVIVTNLLLVGVLRSNPDVLVESGSSIPFSDALHGRTVEVTIDGDGAAAPTTHATVEVGESGRITGARTGTPEDPDYRVAMDGATADAVVVADRPIDVAKQAYAAGRIQVTPLSGGFLQRGVAGVVETVVQVGAGLVPGLGT